MTIERGVNGGAVRYIQPDGPKPSTPVSGQEFREPLRPEIGQGHPLDSGTLEQIVRTGAPLKPSAENQHFHQPTPRRGKNAALECSWKGWSASMGKNTCSIGSLGLGGCALAWKNVICLGAAGTSDQLRIRGRPRANGRIWSRSPTKNATESPPHLSGSRAA